MGILVIVDYKPFSIEDPILYQNVVRGVLSRLTIPNILEWKIKTG
jgi:hypothetical protein